MPYFSEDIMKYKKCPFCNESNEIGYKFCIYCGREFPVDDKPSSHEAMKDKKQNTIRCPACKTLNNPENIECRKCGYQLNEDINSNESYCLNCGRPVKKNQPKCQCGYEFADINCPYCKTSNEYTYNHCTSCGKDLWSSDVTFANVLPHGCTYDDSRILLDWDFLKKEIVKNPHQINGEIHAKVLREQYFILGSIMNEISSRWWIVSPFRCKSCTVKIDAFQERCPKCNIAHYNDDYFNRVMELKNINDNYVESKKNTNELSRLKWTNKLSEADVEDYIYSLAPKIGEPKLDYVQRLIKEWAEISVIQYLIKSEWNIYFEDICMNCGGKFEKYIMNCPSCGMKKDVTPLGALFNDDVVKETFPFQYKAFIEDMKSICRDNDSDINYIDEGVAGCPECSSYFNILNAEFIDTHRCPHCGAHFNITAEIYESDPLGDRRCPNCGGEMELRYHYVDYGDMEGEEARYDCPSCGYSALQYENYL